MLGCLCALSSLSFFYLTREIICSNFWLRTIHKEGYNSVTVRKIPHCKIRKFNNTFISKIELCLSVKQVSIEKWCNFFTSGLIACEKWHKEGSSVAKREGKKKKKGENIWWRKWWTTPGISMVVVLVCSRFFREGATPEKTHQQTLLLPCFFHSVIHFWLDCSR